ncbi:MAG: zinc dependent phospholipase C family protein [Acidobacteriota bacterium]
MKWRACYPIVLLLAAILLASDSTAYSVLTHQELIDLAWNDSIRPLLLAKFPKSTDADLVVAHSFAYGGSAVQDMGYYPFGKVFFSELTHYVRSGDFVMRLLSDARTLNEYAFAIGALSHYLGDSIGHSEAVNPATALAFPKLKDKYGESVTYGESPHSHIRTEFAFDVKELSDRAFAPAAYLERVGFRVPRKFLRDVFIATYGIDIAEVLGRARPDLKSYRTSVRSFIPAFAEAEVVLHKKKFLPPPDTKAYRIFAERVAHTNYERRWRHTYKGPGFKAHLLAILVFIVPKIGAASDLAIKIPTQETEEWYLSSVNRTVDQFRAILQNLLSEKSPARLANLDLDTGQRARLGDYALADKTYTKLLARLTSKPRLGVPGDLKRNLLDYYEGSLAITELNDPRTAQLEALKAMGSRRRADGGSSE